jgi:L-rhamnonate dehydratase
MNMEFGTGVRLDKVEWAALPGERWRNAGCNARLGVHGKAVAVSLVRITAGGIQAFGWSVLTHDRAGALLGQPLKAMFTPEGRVRPEYFDLEFPLLDWLGRVNNQPVYRLVAPASFEDTPGPFSVPCYDTSFYFDDLHLNDDKAAVELMQAQAQEGLSRGHRAFKIKVGRGAFYMPLQEGLQRDVAVVNGIRETAGSSATLMIDANNGYNFNLIKDLLLGTRQANIFWLEEPFHEDAVLYKHLKEWLAAEQLGVLLADGEGHPDPDLLIWAEAGLVDIIQYDLRYYGFERWLALGPVLDAAGVRSAPHNYGGLYGNYASAHIAPAIRGFLFVEWDGGFAEGLDNTAYRIKDGRVMVPDRPGFGLELDDKHFSGQVRLAGWSVA